MRFLMLNWRDPKNPLSGGAERVTLAYLAALAKRGHEVYLVRQRFFGAWRARKSLRESKLFAAAARLIGLQGHSMASPAKAI
ncbi:MAG: hypothetical protein WDM76_00850 [Limisphaerales bacterium]